jgi:Cu/Ag efflux protein CusF
MSGVGQWVRIGGSIQEPADDQRASEKIDESAGKLTIKHDAITNLDMGAMTMVFKANEPAMLKTVRPGEKIKFSADKVNGQLTVMKVEEAK